MKHEFIKLLLAWLFDKRMLDTEENCLEMLGEIEGVSNLKVKQQLMEAWFQEFRVLMKEKVINQRDVVESVLYKYMETQCINIWHIWFGMFSSETMDVFDKISTYAFYDLEYDDTNMIKLWSEIFKARCLKESQIVNLLLNYQWKQTTLLKFVLFQFHQGSENNQYHCLLFLFQIAKTSLHLAETLLPFFENALIESKSLRIVVIVIFSELFHYYGQSKLNDSQFSRNWQLWKETLPSLREYAGLK